MPDQFVPILDLDDVRRCAVRLVEQQQKYLARIFRIEGEVHAVRVQSRAEWKRKARLRFHATLHLTKCACSHRTPRFDPILADLRHPLDSPGVLTSAAPQEQPLAAQSAPLPPQPDESLARRLPAPSRS